MADILPFNLNKKRAKKTRSILCLNGHHKWIIFKKKQFDVKQGKLVTVYRCQRCSAEKVKLL